MAKLQSHFFSYLLFITNFNFMDFVSYQFNIVIVHFNKLHLSSKLDSNSPII